MHRRSKAHIEQLEKHCEGLEMKVMILKSIMVEKPGVSGRS